MDRNVLNYLLRFLLIFISLLLITLEFVVSTCDVSNLPTHNITRNVHKDITYQILRSN